MNEQEILKDFCERENQSALYSYEIDGIPLYPMIRREIRDIYMKGKGVEQMNLKLGVSYTDVCFTLLISLLQILKLLVTQKRAKKVIHTFPRVEMVGNVYVDKFTEPVFLMTNLTDNAIVFSKSFGGKRYEPRLFQKKILYTDIIDLFARVGGIWKAVFLKSSKKKTLYRLTNEINRVCGADVKDISYKHIKKIVLERMCRTNTFALLYKKMRVKKVYHLPRIPDYIWAAHKVGAEVYEFQHGITYGETNLYSGRQLPQCTPDYFLAFGNSQPRDVYGINEDKIITIGWAFAEYVKHENLMPQITEKDVLVICDPEITDVLLDIVTEMAKHRPDINFHFRPHPNQKMDQQQLARIDCLPNICLQDNKINSNIVLNCFTHIIGENSTVLYEAVSINKKVAKLFYNKLHSRYLTETDRQNFFEIHSMEDFDNYIISEPKDVEASSIYSKWDGSLSYLFE